MNTGYMPLADVPADRKAKVTGLVCEGTMRRRLLDLGIIEGTEIKPLYKSPSGNPTAYQVRGTVIALRSDISGKIMVSTS